MTVFFDGTDSEDGTGDPTPPDNSGWFWAIFGLGCILGLLIAQYFGLN
jgi:hypothetical protein